MINPSQALRPQLECAASIGDLDTVITIHVSYGLWIATNNHGALPYAAANGHLPVVEWLYDKRAPGGYLALDWAVQNGHLPVVKFLLPRVSIDQEKSETVLLTAIKCGHLDMAQWMHGQGIGIASLPRAVKSAAENGHANMLPWLKDIGADLTNLETTPLEYIDGRARRSLQSYFNEQRKARMDALVTAAIAEALTPPAPVAPIVTRRFLGKFGL